MPLFRLVCALLLAAVPLSVRAAEITGPRSGKWAFEGSTLKPSPLVTWGRLPNGVRYALLPHKGVPGSVSLRFVVLAGSMDELPDELGIAHFTEHMAFRGTRNLKSDDMKAFFQRIGVEYGSDVNANTTWDNTSFSLDYRENKPELLREGLQLFRDIGDGLTFDPAAIVSERPVIFAEMRARDTLSERKQQAAFPVLFRGMNFAQHVPIGTEKTLNSFTHDSFVRFHDRTYRPDLMIVVAVGDFAVDTMAASIRDAFGSMEPAKTPPPTRDEGRLDTKAIRAGIFRIGGIGSAETLAGTVLPPTGKPDSREAMIERQRRDFVMNLLGERLRTRVPNVGSPDAEYETVLGHDLAIASVQVPGTQWSYGILAVDQIIRNTQKNGFDKAEIDVLRKQQLEYATHAVEQLPTADPQQISEVLAQSITDHTVFVGIAEAATMRREWLEKFTPAEALATFRSLWNIDALAFNVAGDVPLSVNPSDVVAKVQQYRKNGISSLPPPPAQVDLASIKPVGKPSAVAERTTVPDLGAVLMRFGNNIRLNFISNRQEPGLVRVAVRVGSGVMDLPARQPALKEFGLQEVLTSGSGRYRAEQLTQILDEKLLDFSFDVDDRDALTFRGDMVADQLDNFLTIVSEYLARPQFAAYAHDAARQHAAEGREASGTGFMEGMRDYTNVLFAGDARLMWSTPMDYMSVGVPDVRRWLEPALTTSYVEVTIVGDLPEAVAIAAVGKTIGALDSRPLVKKPAANPTLKVVAPAGFRRVEFVGEHNMAMVIGDWPVTGIDNLRDQAAVVALTKILEIRIRERVRQELGLSYGPSTEFQPYDDFVGLAMIEQNADCDPKDAEKVAAAFTEVADKLAREGATQGEFDGAQGILKSQYRRSFLTNEFLVSILLRAQEKPQELNEAVELRRGLLDQLTLAEVNNWAKRVLPSSNSRTAALIPKPLIGVFDSSRPQ